MPLDKLNPQKKISIEKSLEFDYLLLLLCAISFGNLSLNIVLGKPITTLTLEVIYKEISIGVILVSFAAFCFFMSVVFPILHTAVWICLFPLMSKISGIVEHPDRNNSYQSDLDWRYGWGIRNLYSKGVKSAVDF